MRQQTQLDVGRAESSANLSCQHEFGAKGVENGASPESAFVPTPFTIKVLSDQRPLAATSQVTLGAEQPPAMVPGQKA